MSAAQDAPPHLSKALEYARWGWPVFPCKAGAKTPATLHGFKDATTDEARISAWWDEDLSLNIGIPTGRASGIVVLDVDPRNDGLATLQALIAEHGELPITAMVATGGGGYHHYFRYPGAQVRLPHSLGPGVDLQSDGKYVIVPPSVHESGRVYAFTGSAEELAPLPDWIISMGDRNALRGAPVGPEAPIPEGERNSTLASLAGTMRHRGMTKQAMLAALLEENKLRCQPPLAEAEVGGIAESFGKYEPGPAVVGAVSGGWPKPEPLRSELPPVRAFSEDLLPVSFRPLVRDIAERMQVPMDYAAVIAVLCLAGAVNRRATIQPKASDGGWVIVPNLWGGIIAPPGFMKSPVIQAATRPLNQIQTDWRREHEAALNDFGRKNEEYELRLAAWKEQVKASSKKGKAAPDRPVDKPEEPKLRRLIVNDATFEALHQTMSENPAGILVIRDELTGWWSQLDRAGREGERAFCLQAWNGDTGHTIDRIGRGTIHVEACCMSMLGGIQPGRLRSYLVDALKDGPCNDGLIQRFQLLVWPDTPPNWNYVDRAPDAASEQEAARVFRRLVELDPENPARFRFAPDAQELFIEWLAELEAKIRGDELHPALISHLSKYRSLMPTLALLFEIADHASSEGFEGSSLTAWLNFVSLEHTRQAAGLCEYLESHARRVYSCIVTPQLRAARELADKIKQRKLGADGFFSCREVYLKGWSGLDSPEAVKQAAGVLEDAGWVRELCPERGSFGGRPSNRYEVNPRLFE